MFVAWCEPWQGKLACPISGLRGLSLILAYSANKSLRIDHWCMVKRKMYWERSESIPQFPAWGSLLRALLQDLHHKKQRAIFLEESLDEQSDKVMTISLCLNSAEDLHCLVFKDVLKGLDSTWNGFWIATFGRLKCAIQHKKKIIHYMANILLHNSNLFLYSLQFDVM